MKRETYVIAGLIVSVVFALGASIAYYTFKQVQFVEAEIGDLNLASLSAPVTFKLYNPLPYATTLDAVEFNAVYQGRQSASMYVENLQVPAGKTATFTGYILLDRQIAQDIMRSYFAGADIDYSDDSGMKVTWVAKGSFVVPFERVIATN